jgi:xylan 1,4-beta-xylosidase
LFLFSSASSSRTVWNLVPPDQPGSQKIFDLEFRGISKNVRVIVSRVDQDHSNTRAAFAGIGNPHYPTQSQVRQLNRETSLQPPQSLPLKDGHLSLTVPVNGFALLEIPK